MSQHDAICTGIVLVFARGNTLYLEELIYIFVRINIL